MTTENERVGVFGEEVRGVVGQGDVKETRSM